MLKITWNNFSDYSIFKHDFNINDPLITSNGNHIFIREQNTNRLPVSFAMFNGDELFFNNRLLVNTYNVIAHVVNEEDKVLVNTKSNISKLKIYAPYATTLFINEVETPFNRFGDYIRIGPITENETWSSNVTINTDLHVTGEITVTEGTNIQLASGKKIIFKNWAQLTGTAENPVNLFSIGTPSGYGIVVADTYEPLYQGPGIPQGEFNYCNFQNLSYGIEAIAAQIEVNHCNFEECNTGISSKFSEDADNIVNNVFNDCLYGLYIEESFPDVFNNHFIGCQGIGIYNLCSEGVFRNNTVELCGGSLIHDQGGFLAMEGAMPDLESRDPGEYAFNVITENDGFGLCAQNSIILAGSDPETGGGNIIYGNSSYDAEAYEESVIYAMLNYWGTEEPFEEQFYVDGSSEVLFEPWLWEPPEGGESLNITSPYTINFATEKDFNSETIGWRTSLIHYYKNRDHVNLKTMAKTLLSSSLTSPDARFILSALHFSSLIHKDTTFIPYVKNLTTTFVYPGLRRQAKIYLISHYLKTGKIDLAKSLLNDMDIDPYVLFKQFRVALNLEHNIPEAQLLFEKLRTKYSDHAYLHRAQVELEAALGKSKPAIPGLHKKTAIEKIIPVKFALFQNQPNPFNPVSKITFDLPEDSHVKLSVYDIQGKLVQTLVNGKMPAGSHSTYFNGSKLASGIYFYRLETDNFIDTKRMLLIK